MRQTLSPTTDRKSQDLDKDPQIRYFEAYDPLTDSREDAEGFQRVSRGPKVTGLYKGC